MGCLVAQAHATVAIVVDHAAMLYAGPSLRDRPPHPAARLHVTVQGAVQGVGFRPFVYRLATELGLNGWVLNDTHGVEIEVEGSDDQLNRFLVRLSAERPPLSSIESVDVAWLTPVDYEHFEIRQSNASGARTTLVLPDMATCHDCRDDVLDPANRRHGYAFTNCTNCGPRFSIIQALPYDRPNTTMQTFRQCPACQSEYTDPIDRRFHAQPNACPVCGPHLELWGAWNANGTHAQPPILALHDDALQLAVDALRAGQIVAVKGLGGFHLMVDACDPDAVARLRERKKRYEKPFALMVYDLAQAAELVTTMSAASRALLASQEAPIVLLPARQTAPIAPNIAPDSPYLGVMLPSTPLHHLLLAEYGFPVVATSGNLSGEPICTQELEAWERLGPIADCFLVHNRPIQRHVDDSVAMVIDSVPRLLRRARGYAPLPVHLAHAVPCILATGAELKNTIALSVGRQAFISQHIGDLETEPALEAFEHVIADFLRLYEATPVAIAHDLHPDYRATRWAQRIAASDPALPLIGVQHHHAHLAACLADNETVGPALGVTWDGTGYGTDGTIWGGEFLFGDAAEVKRIAHMRSFRLPGGEAAIREPARIALTLLWELYGQAGLERDDLASTRVFRPDERRLLGQMLGRGLNTPATSSAGRLFDAVAALIGLRQQASFEGQAAMALEAAVNRAVSDAYRFEIRYVDGATHTNGHQAPLILDWQPLIEAILDDLGHGTSTGTIAARFHNALVDAIVRVAVLSGTERVALAGGCFQNTLLVERAARQLRQTGFEVLLHRQVPPGDGGISLGQIAVAAAQFERGSATAIPSIR